MAKFTSKYKTVVDVFTAMYLLLVWLKIIEAANVWHKEEMKKAQELPRA